MFDVVVLDCAPARDLGALEVWWIAFGRSCGWPLTNLTDGGDGGTGHSVSDDARNRIGTASKNRWKDPAYRERIISAMRGAKSLEGRARISEASRVRWSDSEYRERTRVRIAEATKQAMVGIRPTYREDISDEAIFALRARGVSVRQIAKAFGVSKQLPKLRLKAATLRH